MVLNTHQEVNCFGRMFCGCTKKTRPKYKEHVRSIYPQEFQVQNVPLNVSSLVSYARQNSAFLKEIGRYLAKLLCQDLFTANFGHVECALSAFLALLEEFHNGSTLPLFELYFIDVIGALMEHPRIELKLLGLKGFKQYARYQAYIGSSDDVSHSRAVSLSSVSIASFAVSLESSFAAPAGYRQLDRFFIFLVELCVEESENKQTRTIVRCAGLSAMLTMLRCNDNAAAHYGAVLPALLDNLPLLWTLDGDRQFTPENAHVTNTSFVISSVVSTEMERQEFSGSASIDVTPAIASVVHSASSTDATYVHLPTIERSIVAALPVVGEASGAVATTLAVSCLTQSVRWLTMDSLPHFLSPIFKHLDASLWQPLTRGHSLLLLVADRERSGRPKFADALIVAMDTILDLAQLHGLRSSIETVQCRILEVLSSLVLQMHPVLSAWQVAVQLLVAKFDVSTSSGENQTGDGMALSSNHVDDSKSLSKAVIGCIGAFSLKLHSRSSQWDLMLILLRRINYDSTQSMTTQNQDRILTSTASADIVENLLYSAVCVAQLLGDPESDSLSDVSHSSVSFNDLGSSVSSSSNIPETLVLEFSRLLHTLHNVEHHRILLDALAFTLLPAMTNESGQVSVAVGCASSQRRLADIVSRWHLDTFDISDTSHVNSSFANTVNVNIAVLCRLQQADAMTLQQHQCIDVSITLLLTEVVRRTVSPSPSSNTSFSERPESFGRLLCSLLRLLTLLLCLRPRWQLARQCCLLLKMQAFLNYVSLPSVSPIPSQQLDQSDASSAIRSLPLPITDMQTFLTAWILTLANVSRHLSPSQYSAEYQSMGHALLPIIATTTTIVTKSNTDTLCFSAQNGLHILPDRLSSPVGVRSPVNVSSVDLLDHGMEPWISTQPLNCEQIILVLSRLASEQPELSSANLTKAISVDAGLAHELVSGDTRHLYAPNSALLSVLALSPQSPLSPPIPVSQRILDGHVAVSFMLPAAISTASQGGVSSSVRDRQELLEHVLARATPLPAIQGGRSRGDSVIGRTALPTWPTHHDSDDDDSIPNQLRLYSPPLLQQNSRFVGAESSVLEFTSMRPGRVVSLTESERCPAHGPDLTASHCKANMNTNMDLDMVKLSFDPDNCTTGNRQVHVETCASTVENVTIGGTQHFALDRGRGIMPSFVPQFPSMLSLQLSYLSDE